MTVKQISVFIEKQAGAISAFANILRENGIDMRALSRPMSRITAFYASLWIMFMLPPQF